MRILVTSAVIAACVASAALAQIDEQPMVFVPTWEAEPPPAIFIRHYPPQALHHNVSSIVILCCTPRDDGSVDCVANSTWPEGQGFAEASLRAARGYRLSPESHADLAARPGTQVRISVRWVAPVPAPGAVDELRRRDRESLEACLPPAA